MSVSKALLKIAVGTSIIVILYYGVRGFHWLITNWGKIQNFGAYSIVILVFLLTSWVTGHFILRYLEKGFD